jgi:uncharacterized membrane protein YkvA (DUF1232 family)
MAEAERQAAEPELRATAPRGSGRTREFFALLPRMARLVYHLARDPRVPLKAKLAVVGLGAYIVSPVDLIPDWIPWAGALDDVLLIPIVMNYVFATVPEEVLIEHWGEDIETLRRWRVGRSRPSEGRGAGA